MAEPTNGFTTKEMLVRIDGKLDAALARIAALELKQGIHEARPYHSEATQDELNEKLDGLAKDNKGLNKRVNYAAGAIAFIVAAGPFVFYLLHNH